MERYFQEHSDDFLFRNPNGLVSSVTGSDWPLYTYPEREHIILDVVNKSTGFAHRADYCAFWEHYIPILLEEFGRMKIEQFCRFDSFSFQNGVLFRVDHRLY